MGIIEFLSSAAFGGITGLVGGLVNRVADYFTTKELHKHEQTMLDKNTEYLRIETERDVQVAREESNRVREQSDAQLMEASFKADQATYFSPTLASGLPDWIQGVAAFLMALVDFVRGMTRPGLTLYLCILTTLMYLQMIDLLRALDQSAFDPALAVDIVQKIVAGVIYLATMAVGWWFASRQKSS